jgi:hypothetical protein
MIIAVTRTPMRADTNVRAPRISAAPIDANKTTIQDIPVSPKESRKLAPRLAAFGTGPQPQTTSPTTPRHQACCR